MDRPDGVETSPPPAVSSLRSRFEKLAADSSASAATLKPSSSQVHLSPNLAPPSPRLAPAPEHAHDREPSDSSVHSLRSSTSSSDLKSPAKRPPPPPPFRPPSRAASPANPRASPLLRPLPDAQQPSIDLDPSPEPTSVAAKAALLSRRPPPPPPSQELRPSGVSSLIKQFG